MLVVRPHSHSALAIPTASRAQDPAAPDAQEANDPIELAARHVQVWETAGERWAILSGEAAVLQAGDGLRAREAVVRIIEVSMEDGKGYQAEIYAEGEVRISGRGARHDLRYAPCFGPVSRCSFRLQGERPHAMEGASAQTS